MKRIAAVFALLLALLFVPGCTSYASTIEKNWGLRLPDGYREVIEECASEARSRAAGDMADEIEGYHQLLLEKGMTEVKLDEAVVEALKEKSGEVREMVKSELGEELYNSLITAVEQAKQ